LEARTVTNDRSGWSAKGPVGKCWSVRGKRVIIIIVVVVVFVVVTTYCPVRRQTHGPDLACVYLHVTFILKLDVYGGRLDFTFHLLYVVM